MLFDPRPGGKDVDALLNRVSTRGGGGDRVRPTWIAFHAIGGAVAWPVVEERVQVGRVVIQPKAGTHDRVGTHLIGDAYARTEVSVDGVIQRTDLVSLKNYSTKAGAENGKVLKPVVQRTLIIPTQAVVDIHFRRQLPRVLGKEVEGIDEDLAFGIA